MNQHMFPEVLAVFPEEGGGTGEADELLWKSEYDNIQLMKCGDSLKAQRCVAWVAGVLCSVVMCGEFAQYIWTSGRCKNLSWTFAWPVRCIQYWYLL